MTEYNLANIRTLLIEGFSAEELRRLCYDVPNFRPVYDSLAQNSGKAEIVDHLLEYAERKLLLNDLLSLAKKYNPARYRSHQPYQVKYDVFVSYSQTDQAWVQNELLPRLKVSNLKVCVDFQNFESGASSVAEVEQTVLYSSKVLLVLTRDYLKSTWVEFEHLILQVLDSANHKRRLIPLLKAQCALPSLIDQLTYIDFTASQDRIVAWTQLLTALGVPPILPQPSVSTPTQWHLAHSFAMLPNFTGRVAERQMLSQWLNMDSSHPFLVLRALGGFGKSALTWYWLLRDVEPNLWPRVVWWSFYQSNTGFEGFLRETLAYLSDRTSALDSLDPQAQVRKLLQMLENPGILLILNGFERALWAYSETERNKQTDLRDCLSPIANYFLREVSSRPRLLGKVLMTTRLRPRVLEVHGSSLLQGCREEILSSLQADDAVAFFNAQGIRGSRTKIKQACAVYGYHPLSLRLLASRIIDDFQQPGDIAIASRLDVSSDLVQRHHHVLEQPYEQLTPACRQLLNHIAGFEKTVSYAVLAQTRYDGDLDTNLPDLLSWSLVQRDRQTNQFDLHPIVRRYIQKKLAEAQKRKLLTRFYSQGIAYLKTEVRRYTITWWLLWMACFYSIKQRIEVIWTDRKTSISILAILFLTVAVVVGIIFLPEWRDRMVQPPVSPISIEAFLITRQDNPTVTIKPDTRTTVIVSEIIPIKVKISTIDPEREEGLSFVWYTCKEGDNPVKESIGKSEMLYIVPSEPGVDCISVVIGEGGKQLDKEEIFVDVQK